MASVKKITMREYNGTDYDTLYPKTIASQVDGIYGKEEILTDATKTLYGLNLSATPNDVFAKLAMPYGYYGFDVTTVFSDGTPVPFVVLNGLQDISGNTAITDENGRCPITMIDNKTPTITISNYIGVVDKEVTITVEEGVVFTPVTITLERDTSMHLIETSQTLKVLMGVPVDMCIVGGGASGIFRTTNGDFPGGGGGYVTNILGAVLTNPNITLIVGSGGPRDLNGNGNYAAGGDTSIEYNGIIATAEGAKNQTGNGNGGNGASSGKDGTIHVFNDDSLPLPGGGGGGGNRGEGSPGGLDFGGHGGSWLGSSSTVSATSGTGPGGGGGGGARSGPYDYVYSANGHDGGLYIRVNAPEVSA